MQKKIIKYQSFGAPFEERNKEYTCLKDWPSNISIKCGDKGVVLKKNGGYVTAFFEVFSDDDFIRGEGENLEDAENHAFEKLMKIKNCLNHNYKQNGDSVDAECSLCSHKEKKYFPPTGTCSQCGQIHTQLKINKESFCIKHYIEKAKTMDFTINDVVINKIKQDIFTKINEEKEKDKNIIELMMNKKDDQLTSYKDIPDDDYRVEMKIEAIEEISNNVKLFEIFINLGIDKKYEDEYKFINYILDLKDMDYMKCCATSLDTVKRMIKLMLDDNLIKGELEEINFQYNLKDKKIVDDLIEFFKLYMISLKVEKKYNIKSEVIVEMFTGKSVNDLNGEIINNLKEDILKFVNENKKKIDFKRKIN